MHAFGVNPAQFVKQCVELPSEFLYICQGSQGIDFLKDTCKVDYSAIH